MAIDPKIAALLDGTLADLAASVKEIKALLDVPVVVVPPLVVTIPVSIISVTTSRSGDNAITVRFTLAGSNSRVMKYGVSVAPAGWQEFSVPSDEASRMTGTVVVTNNVKPTAGVLHFHVWDGVLGAWVHLDNIAFTGTAPPVIVVPPVIVPPVGTGPFSFKVDPSNNALSLYNAGNLFIPIGVNIPGPNGYWGGGFTPVGKAARLRDTWGWNFIRLFEQRTTGGDAPFCPSAHNPYTIAQVVEEYTSAGFTVMLDWHQYGFGAEYGPANTAEMIKVHTAWANQFKDNPRVWFELANEPEATFHSYNHGAKNDAEAKAMCYQRWYDAFAPVVQAIRSTGATNMIVVCDAQSGMGCDDFWMMGPSTGSAIIAKGKDLLAQDPTGNLMWDVHVYDAFGWAGPQAMTNTCVARYSNSQRDARLADYVRRVWAATGRPVLAGEFGWQVKDRETTGAGFHGPYTPLCGSRTLLAQKALTRTALQLNMGGAQWPGFQLCTSGVDAYDASVLTDCGKDWYDFGLLANRRMLGTFLPTAPKPELLTETIFTALGTANYPIETRPVSTAHTYGLERLANPVRNTQPDWARKLMVVIV